MTSGTQVVEFMELIVEFELNWMTVFWCFILMGAGFCQKVPSHLIQGMYGLQNLEDFTVTSGKDMIRLIDC